MKNKLLIVALLTFISTNLFANDIPTSLNYRSFYEQVNRGDISEFTIYKDYKSDIDGIAKDKDGKTYVIDRPYRYYEDEFFMGYLKGKDVSIEILDDVYKGELPEGTKKKSRMMYVGLLFYLIPIALIIAIVMLAKTVSRQTKVIESLTNKISNHSSDPT